MTKPCKSIVHIVLNDFPPDYRVLKEVNTLSKNNYKVKVYAKWGGKRPLNEYTDKVHIKRFSLLTRNLPKKLSWQTFKYFECIVLMVRSLCIERPKVIHCHDLNALVIGWIAKKLLRAKLIYDSHELWSDTNERGMPKWYKTIAIHVEKILSENADKVITVSRGIADELKNRYKIEYPVILRNVPESIEIATNNNLRKRLAIPDKSIVLIYIGGILKNRGVETILKAFESIEKNNLYLVFLGSESIPKWINVKIKKSVLKRLRFQSLIPPRDVIGFSSGADIGLHAIRNTSLSHKYCLPNKLFEYIHAGLAVIVTDLPEMKKLVKEYNVGSVFPDGDYESLSKEILMLYENKERLDEFKISSRCSKSILNWEKEQNILVSLYESIIKNLDNC